MGETMNHALNEVFTNPRITKVMHGADSDVLWLQRDFGLYVVALFDTGQAARVLQFSSYSLAYLLERYAGVAANKKFALADWRIRPLGDEMIRCAVPPPPRTTRTHTHPRPPRRNQPCYIHARHPTPHGDTISRILRRPRRARGPRRTIPPRSAPTTHPPRPIRAPSAQVRSRRRPLPPPHLRQAEERARPPPALWHRVAAVGRSLAAGVQGDALRP